MNYLMYMGFLLFMPIVIAYYIFPIGRGEKPDKAMMVWVLFAFYVWMAHSNFQNNQAKWEVCSQLEERIGYDYLPEVCWEAEYEEREGW